MYPQTLHNAKGVATLSGGVFCGWAKILLFMCHMLLNYDINLHECELWKLWGHMTTDYELKSYDCELCSDGMSNGHMIVKRRKNCLSKKNWFWTKGVYCSCLFLTNLGVIQKCQHFHEYTNSTLFHTPFSPPLEVYRPTFLSSKICVSHSITFFMQQN